jgi:hypothetical protein
MVRISRIPSEVEMSNRPSSATNGKLLPVFGSFAAGAVAAVSAVAGAGAAAGFRVATRIGTSAGGACGRGVGIVPETCLC